MNNTYLEMDENKIFIPQKKNIRDLNLHSTVIESTEDSPINKPRNHKPQNNSHCNACQCSNKVSVSCSDSVVSECVDPCTNVTIPSDVQKYVDCRINKLEEKIDFLMGVIYNIKIKPC